MKLLLPDINLLKKTGAVDYFYWNYKFPIKYIQVYRFKRIVKLLAGKKYNTLLEAGTGSGIFIPELAKHCNNIYACDIHTNFNHIPELCKHYGINNCNVSTQSIEATNYADKQFDAVVAVSVLEFVPDTQKALTEIKRILKKDGVFITICPMESKILDFFLSLYTTKKPKDEFGKARLSVGKLLEQNFEVEKKGYMLPIIGKLFPVYTHYKLKNTK
jgi:ubiquinone/menaquinone biosynthesis C-methylase UbiE